MSSKPKPSTIKNDLQTILEALKSFLESVIDPECAIATPHPSVIPYTQRFLQRSRSGYQSVDQESFLLRSALLAAQPHCLKTEAMFREALDSYSASLTLLNTSRLERGAIDLGRVTHLLAFVSALIDPINGIQRFIDSQS